MAEHEYRLCYAGRQQVKPQVSDAFVCQMDLLASFAALLGQTYPDQAGQRKYLGRLFGQESRRDVKNLVIEGMFNYAYRQGDWALDSSLL